MYEEETLIRYHPDKIRNRKGVKSGIPDSRNAAIVKAGNEAEKLDEKVEPVIPQTVVRNYNFLGPRYHIIMSNLVISPYLKTAKLPFGILMRRTISMLNNFPSIWIGSGAFKDFRDHSKDQLVIDFTLWARSEDLFQDNVEFVFFFLKSSMKFHIN